MKNFLVAFIFFTGLTAGIFWLTLQFLSPVQTKSNNQSAEQNLIVIMSLKDALYELEICVAKYKKDRIKHCSNAALQLAQNLRRQGNDFDLRHYKKGLFHLYMIENKLLYLKENCTKQDINIDIFPINYHPKDLQHIPEDRRKKGLKFLNQAAYFSKNGFQVKTFCLMVTELKLNWNAINRIQTGQYKKGWIWSVFWKFDG